MNLQYNIEQIKTENEKLKDELNMAEKEFYEKREADAYRAGYEDGKRDAVQGHPLDAPPGTAGGVIMDWHEWSEKPERGGVFLVLLTNTRSRTLKLEIGTYDWCFEEWTVPKEGDETPRYWMEVPEMPEWDPEWDKDLVVDVEEENE